jgi:hypothetical protein
MANVKIGDLSATGSVVSTDGFFPIVGTALDTTYKISVKNLANALPQVSSSISSSYVTGSIFTGGNRVTSASYAITASNAATASYYAGGAPGGSDTQLQYRQNSTTFGGVTTAVYDGTTLRATGSFSGSFSGLLTGSFTGSLTGIINATGSLFGTSSWATNATTAATASSVSNLNQNLVITGSLTISSSLDVDFITVGNTVITGSLVVSGSNGAGVFSQGATLVDYSSGGGIANSGSYMVWRAPFSCSVVAMYGYREGGGPAQVNAARSGSSGFALLTGSNLALTVGNVWSASLNVTASAANFNTGDSLRLIMSGSASNNQLAIQVDFVRKF